MTSHQRPSHDCADLSVPRYVRCRNSHCKHPRASWRALSPRIIYRFRPLRVCRTVPRLATGTLRFSYPQTLPGGAIACRSVPVATRPQPRYRRLRFGCRSYRLSPPKDGAAWILPNPKSHGFPLSGNRRCSPDRRGRRKLAVVNPCFRQACQNSFGRIRQFPYHQVPFHFGVAVFPPTIPSYFNTTDRGIHLSALRLKRNNRGACLLSAHLQGKRSNECRER